MTEQTREGLDLQSQLTTARRELAVMTEDRDSLLETIKSVRAELAEARQELAEYQGDNLSRCCACRFDDGKLTTECLQHAEMRQALEAERAGAGAMRRAINLLPSTAAWVSGDVIAECHDAIESTAGASLLAELTDLRAKATFWESCHRNARDFAEIEINNLPKTDLRFKEAERFRDYLTGQAEQPNAGDKPLLAAHASEVEGLRGEVAELTKLCLYAERSRDGYLAQRDAAVERLKELVCTARPIAESFRRFAERTDWDANQPHGVNCHVTRGQFTAFVAAVDAELPSPATLTTLPATEAGGGDNPDQSIGQQRASEALRTGNLEGRCPKCGWMLPKTVPHHCQFPTGDSTAGGEGGAADGTSLECVALLDSQHAVAELSSELAALRARLDAAGVVVDKCIDAIENRRGDRVNLLAGLLNNASSIAISAEGNREWAKQHAPAVQSALAAAREWQAAGKEPTDE